MRLREHSLWGDQRVADGALAAGIAALQLFGTHMAAQSQPDRRQLDVFAVLLLGGGALALVARRRYPVAVLAIAFVTTFAYELLEYPGGPIWGSLIVAFYTVQTTGHRAVGFLALAIGFTSIWWEPALLDRPAPSTGEAIAFAAWALVLIAVPEIVRTRRAYVDEVGLREHDEERRRRSEQRVEIARDLHDVLAHNISLINVQASTALHLLDEHPEQARPALQAIKHASSEALSELRGVLEALRRPDDAPSKAPAPTLSDVDALTAQAAAAGLPIETVIEGEPRPLPASVELAAFRICQEAVTNVIRHAGPATARLKLTYGTRDLTVQIEDDGRGTNGSSGGGNGLAGMRERTVAVGGELQAGPRPEGGFRVRATLPLR